MHWDSHCEALHLFGGFVYEGGYVTRAKANPTLGMKLHTAQKYKHLKQCRVLMIYFKSWGDATQHSSQTRNRVFEFF